MSEFITIQVGQCGNQIGGALWPLILDEYRITQVPDGIQRDSCNKSSNVLSEGFHSFFDIPDGIKAGTPLQTYYDLQQQKVKARAVIIDMEDGVIKNFRTGPLQNLFQNNQVISNYPGSGNNWAEGYFEHGNQYSNKILKVLQRAVEKCDSLHGFLMLFSTGGGTGSGLGTRTLKFLKDNFPKIDRFVCPVYPSGTEDVITAPYNVALATDQLIEHGSCVFPIENRALLRIVSTLTEDRTKDTARYMATCRPFQDLNSIIVNMLLHLTSGSRFPGNLNLDMSDIIANMVPFPHTHYLSSSYAPLTICSPKINEAVNNRQLLENLFNGVTNPNNQLVRLNLLEKDSVLMGATFGSRGPLTISDMRYLVKKLQTKANFTPWSKTAIKLGICTTPPAGHEQSLLGLFNTSSMVSLFENVNRQFTQLYRRKAHVHHYHKINGFEHDHFDQCKERIQQCIDNYKDLKQFEPQPRPRFQVL